MTLWAFMILLLCKSCILDALLSLIDQPLCVFLSISFNKELKTVGLQRQAVILWCRLTRPLSPRANLPWCLAVRSPGTVSQAEVTNSSTTAYCNTSLCFITFHRAAETRRTGGARSRRASKGRLASECVTRTDTQQNTTHSKHIVHDG